ncbi:MAG: DNA-processing protein DprA [Paludibacteraceae bacterium]|nr:DNA-processing protein DprA [Paludibacteraceae bacterium]
MNYDPIVYRIGLTLIKGVGPALAKNLIAYLGNEEAIFTEKAQNLAKIPGIGDIISKEIVQQDVLQRAHDEVDFIIKNNVQALYFTDREYPYRLKECADSPIMLYSRGNCNLNQARFVAIVGTRNATDEGKENCRKLVSGLATLEPPCVIVSGLAYGVDICAHKAALDAGMPTIAVVGHGLDRIYPSAHRPTAARLIDNGMLLTEYISGTNPDRPNFVQRNRIIAGLSDVTIVVESASRGGALITAEAANEYNRDVFAFPGRVTDLYSAGCNTLIKNNKAALIESTDDLVKFMSWENTCENKIQPVQTSLFMDLTDEEQILVGILRQQANGLQMNELSLKTNQSVSKTSAMLLELEFKGMVKCLPGNVYKIVK